MSEVDAQGLFQYVPLFLSNGEEVGIVVKVPQFNERPVIFWGQRVFVWHSRFHQYRESFAWTVLEYKKT
jgi:hypothetical protein